jgi:1-phosphatidylinositol-4-phosphate 5-kinase
MDRLISMTKMKSDEADPAESPSHSRSGPSSEVVCRHCDTESARSSMVPVKEKDAKEDDESDFDLIPNDYSGKLQAAFYNMMAAVDFKKASGDETVFLDLPAIGVDLKVMNPRVFGLIQELYGEDKVSLVKSVCNSGNLSGGPSKGKSSSFFYLTHDKKFLLKTMTKAEYLFLKNDFLEKYEKHLAENLDSLLPKFFLCFKMTYGAFSKRYILMNNVFDTDIPIHEVFDLKGSTVGREVSQKELEKSGPGKVIWKDLDFDKKRYKLFLPEAVIVLLLIQLEQDIEFLRSCNVIDYSLLLGIHNYSKLPTNNSQPAEAKAKASVVVAPIVTSTVSEDGLDLNLNTASMKNLWEKKIKKHMSSHSPAFKTQTALQIQDDEEIAHIQQKFRNFQSISEDDKDEDSEPKSKPPVSKFSFSKSTSNSNSGSYTNVPAVGSRRESTKVVSRLSAESVYVSPYRMEKGGICGRDEQGKAKPYHYFLGIIDILQPYNTRKVLETQMKSLQHEATEISCVDPDLYSARFFKRMCSMFG